jgi:glyoxalase family protein
MTITGLHHISLICSNAQKTIDFYTETLGLRLVKKTVNFDDPGAYHLYFGNASGSPGSVVTFFEYPSSRQGSPGMGGTHHYALQTANYDSLLKWKRWLSEKGLQVDGPLDRHYFTSIYFRDPDGAILEIATQGPGWTRDEEPGKIGTEYRKPPEEMLVRNRDEERIRAENWPERIDQISRDMALENGMHHITAIGSDIERTHGFFGDLLGMRRVKMTSNFDDPGSAHWYWGVGDGHPGTLITYFERDPSKEPPAKMGAGQTHHFALVVAGEESQLEWREKLLSAGLSVTPVKDRVYFKSIYLKDPDGHIVELATSGPGFTVDEDPSELGRSLKLPPWMEDRRSEIEDRLTPVKGRGRYAEAKS